MNTFTLVQRALDATLDDPAKVGLGDRDIETGRIVSAVQTVVDALTPPDGGRYIVGFADISTAQTSLGERRITVSSKPLSDRSLTLVEKAVVIATFAAHEIGHTLVTRPREDRVQKHNPHTGYHAVANLADDIILEPVMVDRFPILADAFTFTGEWVLRATAKELPKTHVMSPDMTTADRFNMLLSATRYGDIAEIVWPPAAIEERDWGRAWADRLIDAPLADHDTFLALCDEAWVRLRSKPEIEEPIIVETQPGGDDEPDDEPSDEDGEDEGEGGSDDGESENEGDESDEDGESEGEGEDEGEGNESEAESEADDATDGDDTTDDADGESEDGDPDEGEAENEGPGSSNEGEGEGDVNDQPRDWDDDEDDDDATSTTPEGSDNETADSLDTPDDAEGGGGNSAADDAPLRDEDDFDRNKVEQSMHDSAERDPYDWNAQQVEQAVRTYVSTTVTAFGRHGSITTTWE
jgi:hypothetical protein